MNLSLVDIHLFSPYNVIICGLAHNYVHMEMRVPSMECGSCFTFVCCVFRLFILPIDKELSILNPWSSVFLSTTFLIHLFADIFPYAVTSLTRPLVSILSNTKRKCE